ncbi:MAG: tRNA-splicing endonuclease subunit sen54 [Phylliscum demangeonii]|nr:MAG: tRNA-splicing endonuclease subunit sen54 [Phylliscum demangeonii]
MASANDAAALHPPTAGHPPPRPEAQHPADASADNDDDDDEAQDYRFLASLTAAHLRHAGADDDDGADDDAEPRAAIPRRGAKDFEPHGTAQQAALLGASRAAMHQALSSTAPGGYSVRLHTPKAGVRAYWDAARGCCLVPHARGPHFKTMGAPDRGAGARPGWLRLRPEEMLYLLERGSLDVRWGEGEGEDGDGDGVPMSVQAAYAVAIGDGRRRAAGCISLERWSVYAGLKRCGYAVFRAPGWLDEEDEDEEEDEEEVEEEDGGPRVGRERELGEEKRLVQAQPLPQPQPQPQPQQPPPPPNLFWLFRRLFGALFSSPMRAASSAASSSTHAPLLPPRCPLVTPGLYRSYNEIYRALQLIPYHDPATTTTTTALPPPPPPPPHTPYRIAFHVHKPRPHFRKSAPGPADFYIAVVDARAAPFPSLAQLAALLESVPVESSAGAAALLPGVPGGGGGGGGGGGAGLLYQRLKRGHGPHVILAVVDQGVTSYLRVSEAVFGRERLYDRFDRFHRGAGAGGEAGRVVAEEDDEVDEVEDGDGEAEAEAEAEEKCKEEGAEGAEQEEGEAEGHHHHHHKIVLICFRQNQILGTKTKQS